MSDVFTAVPTNKPTSAEDFLENMTKFNKSLVQEVKLAVESREVTRRFAELAVAETPTEPSLLLKHKLQLLDSLDNVIKIAEKLNSLWRDSDVYASHEFTLQLSDPVKESLPNGSGFDEPTTSAAEHLGGGGGGDESASNEEQEERRPSKQTRSTARGYRDSDDNSGFVVSDSEDVGGDDGDDEDEDEEDLNSSDEEETLDDAEIDAVEASDEDEDYYEQPKKLKAKSAPVADQENAEEKKKKKNNAESAAQPRRRSERGLEEFPYDRGDVFSCIERALRHGLHDGLTNYVVHDALNHDFCKAGYSTTTVIRRHKEIVKMLLKYAVTDIHEDVDNPGKRDKCYACVAERPVSVFRFQPREFAEFGRNDRTTVFTEGLGSICGERMEIMSKFGNFLDSVKITTPKIKDILLSRKDFSEKEKTAEINGAAQEFAELYESLHSNLTSKLAQIARKKNY